MMKNRNSFNKRRRLYIYTYPFLLRDMKEGRYRSKVGETARKELGKSGVITRIKEQDISTSTPETPQLIKWWYSSHISDKQLHIFLKQKYKLTSADTEREWFSLSADQIYNAYQELETKMNNKTQNNVEKIYANQSIAANKLFEYIQRGEKRVMLVAQMQSGKTGALQALYAKICEKYKEVFNNCFIPADLTLKEQLQNRFNCKTFYDELTNKNVLLAKRDAIDVFYPNAKELKEVNFEINYNQQKNIVKEHKNNNSSGFILTTLDEAHSNISNDGNFAEIIRKFNLPLADLYNQQIMEGLDYTDLDLSYNDNFEDEFGLLITATPSPQINFAKKYYQEHNKLPFPIVYLKSPDNYLGFEKIKKQGRFKQGFKIMDNIQQFNIEVLEDFLKGKPGYGILRITSKDNTKHYEEIKQNIESIARVYNKKINVKKYESNQNNISDLDSDIQNPTNEYHVCIIIQSYLQGKTFETTDNIRFWFDTFDKKGENDVFVAQSVGRNCGYGKEKNTYPIWTDLEAIEKYIKFNQIMSLIEENPSLILELPNMTGTFIKSIKSKNKSNLEYNYELFFHKDKAERDYAMQELLTESTSMVINSVALNNTENIIKDICEKRNFPHYIKKNSSNTDSIICGSFNLEPKIMKNGEIDTNWKFYKSWNQYVNLPNNCDLDLHTNYQQGKVLLTVIGKKITKVKRNSIDQGKDIGSWHTTNNEKKKSRKKIENNFLPDEYELDILIHEEKMKCEEMPNMIYLESITKEFQLNK